MGASKKKPAARKVPTTNPKYPRIIVTAKRHAQLTKEANKRGIFVTELVEDLFKELLGK